MKIEKIPSVKCKKCGSTNVIIISKNKQECFNCGYGKKENKIVELSEEVEFFASQINNEQPEEES